MSSAGHDFDDITETDTHSSLNRELDSKKRLLDTMEASINKMSNTKLQWRTRLTMKEDELADAKVRRLASAQTHKSERL